MIETSCLTKGGRYVKEYARSVNEIEIERMVYAEDGGYLKEYATFDIETTTIEDKYKSLKKGYDCYKAFMYHWQVCILGEVYFGRTWSELQFFFNELIMRMNLSEKRKLVIYVHNLSYEYYFMKSFFKITKVFATDRHSVLKAIMNDVFELRCSYKLTNMSLQKFIENSKRAIHIKGCGDLDYRVKRTPKTVLTAKELGYCYNDVKGLHEAIQDLTEEEKNLKSIPLTSTGFVRRDCRNSMRTNKKNRIEFKKNKLTYELYKLFTEAIRGGNTASSRFYVDEIVSNVKSKDIASSYPFVMLTRKYPKGKFMKGSIKYLDELEEYNENYCTVGRYTFKNVVLKPEIVIPYLSFSKCNKCVNSKSYNGRVLRAEYIVNTMTNIDFKIFNEQYNYESFIVEDFYYSKKDYLPIEIRQQILKYFRTKCRYKGNEAKYYEYMKDKGKLNAIFGMMVTDILQESLREYNGVFVDVMELKKLASGESPTQQEIEEHERKLLDAYYNKENNFLSYQWGVYVTAYARELLERAIKICGMDLLYTDTDSVKYIGDHEKDFEELNKAILQECKGIEHYADINGKRYYMGIFENDGDYKKFRTLGAKKYCYIDKDDKLHITVAGLNKEKGAEELNKKGGVEHFKEGEIFLNSGRTASQFNEEEVHTIVVDGVEIVTGSNIAIYDVPYTLGISDTIKSTILMRGGDIIGS